MTNTAKRSDFRGYETGAVHSQIVSMQGKGILCQKVSTNTVRFYWLYSVHLQTVDSLHSGQWSIKTSRNQSETTATNWQKRVKDDVHFNEELLTGHFDDILHCGHLPSSLLGYISHSVSGTGGWEVALHWEHFSGSLVASCTIIPLGDISLWPLLWINLRKGIFLSSSLEEVPLNFLLRASFWAHLWRLHKFNFSLRASFWLTVSLAAPFYFFLVFLEHIWVQLWGHFATLFLLWYRLFCVLLNGHSSTLSLEVLYLLSFLPIHCSYLLLWLDIRWRSVLEIRIHFLIGSIVFGSS